MSHLNRASSKEFYERTRTPVRKHKFFSCNPVTRSPGVSDTLVIECVEKTCVRVRPEPLKMTNIKLSSLQQYYNPVFRYL